MSWRERLQELLCAGGAVTLTGCPIMAGGTCNANPDPCCQVEYAGSRPDLKPECDAKHACEQQGGTWSDPYLNAGSSDAGVPHCIFTDAGVGDAPKD